MSRKKTQIFNVNVYFCISNNKNKLNMNCCNTTMHIWYPHTKDFSIGGNPHSKFIYSNLYLEFLFFWNRISNIIVCFDPKVLIPKK